MKYSEILKSLYEGNLDKIIIILQESVYATHVKKNEEGDIIIHTGFSFETHKSKRMEILLGLSEFNNQIKIIRQPVVFKSLPQINGLKLSSDTEYFNKFYPYIITEIEEEDNDYNLKEFFIDEPEDFFYSENFKEIKLDVTGNTEKSIREIEVITENNESLKFALQKKLTSLIFFDGHNFMKYEKNQIDSHRNNNSEYHTMWRNDPGTDDYYNEEGMRRDDEYNPENWQGHDG